MIVRAGGQAVAYGGLWLMVDEAHITTFAVLPQWRRQGIGGRLMVELMRLAVELHAQVVTLEVRLTNHAARGLYARFGFRPVGVRPRYYSDNNEDALIMTTSPLDSREMVARMAELSDSSATAATTRSPARDRQRSHPRCRDLVRRDGRGRRRGRTPDRGQRRRQPGRASRGNRRHRARGRGARASALDDPGARGGARRGRHRRLVGASRRWP